MSYICWCHMREPHLIYVTCLKLITEKQLLKAFLQVCYCYL